MSQRDQSVGKLLMAYPACRENAPRFRHLDPGYGCHRPCACRAEGQTVYQISPGPQGRDVDLTNSLRTKGHDLEIAQDFERSCLKASVLEVCL